MRFFMLAGIVGLCMGCSEYQAARLHLLDQARKGLAMVKDSQPSVTARAESLAKMQRKLLDDAFDQDVLRQTELSADWVIDHRKAYAVGFDALAVQ